jgi:transcriptional regulator with XRE-family HTH domain
MEASIGRLLRERREALGLTQQALAGQIGIAYQQLQRYERGTNSITAVRLHRLARALDLPIEHFLEE